MALPAAKDSPEPARAELLAEVRQLKSSLVILDNLVMEFVTSPIFEQTKTVDVQMAAKARRALEGIIVVSDQIKKSSEKLKKLSPKSEPPAPGAAQNKP
jgi:hypothetical protein